MPCSEPARRRSYVHAGVALQACSESRLFTKASALAAAAVPGEYKAACLRVCPVPPCASPRSQRGVKGGISSFLPPNSSCVKDPGQERPTSCLSQSQITRQVPPSFPNIRLIAVFPLGSLQTPKVSAKKPKPSRPSDEQKAALRFLIESMAPLCFNVQRHKYAKRALC